jgi:hypothetical protein
MADEKTDLKTLEMRLAALEDKLSKLNVSEEDMKTYERVANALGTGGQTSLTPNPDSCTVCQISRQRLVCINRGIIPRQIIRFCNECFECGPCAMGGGGFSGGGGFGGFGG